MNRSALVLLVPVLALAAQLHAQDASGAPHRTFGIACEQCHTAESWHVLRSDASFDHTLTGFTLSGRHAGASCATCHRGHGLLKTGAGCVSCHSDPHRAEYGDACSMCHTPDGWRSPVRAVAMHESTRFPLLGAHRLANCTACHTNQQKNEFAPIPTACDACHRADYQRTQAPDHAALSFPMQCAQCHKVEQPSWKPAMFAHDTFPLTGGHMGPACTACHPGGRYAGTPTACDACHRRDYDATKNPAHAAAGIPVQCARCHTTAGWRPASFDHSATRFPLTGAHATTPCASCHVNGQWSGLPTTCIACHTADFNGTTNPNHKTNAFPSDCTTCHTTSGWTPSTFNHDASWFPIYSGHHRGKWTACSQCHTTPGSYTAYSCVDCHEHNKTQMDNEHRGRSGYVYNSADCLRCHPRG